MRSVSCLLSLLPGIALPTGCNQKVQKDNGQNSQKPNIIYIFADDLGIGDLSCYGAAKVSTPHIDRLAGQGVQFTNAYVTSAINTLSRFRLLTGMCLQRQGNTGIAPGNLELIVGTAYVTMADMLKEVGYVTGVIDEWHLGLGPKGGTDFSGHITPNAQSIGFSYEFVTPATTNRVPCVFVEDGRVVGLDPNDPIIMNYEHKVGDWPTGEGNPGLVKPKPSQGHNNMIINGIPRIGWMTGGESAFWKDEDVANIITNKAKSFIVSHKEEPFFLYMDTQDVHVPRAPHPRFAERSGLGTRGDVILQLDWTIGEVMNTLDNLQLTDNTILIFTSDNGPVIDDGYQDQAFERLSGHTPMGIYRGGKYNAYEAGTRTPFIVRWPAKVKPSKQQALFSQIDIFALLAALLKQLLPKGAAPDNQEHLNTLLGKDYTSREYIVQQNLNNTLAIVKRQWKYIKPSDALAIEYWTKTELGNDRHPQLYDLSTDPSEKNNAAKQHPEVARELFELFESMKTR